MKNRAYDLQLKSQVFKYNRSKIKKARHSNDEAKIMIESGLTEQPLMAANRKALAK